MNRLLKRANKRIPLTNAAALLVGASLLGQILGFMRVQIINASFPNPLGPNSTDLYFAAFKIPDFFFYTIAAGALGVAFMPYLSDRLEKGDRKGIWELTSDLLNLLAVLMLIFGVIMLIFAESLIKLIISKDLTPEQLHNAATIMRLISLNPLLFTISGILTTVQQTFGRFFFFAVAPIIYNASIIVSAVVFRDSSLGIVGLGLGALAGAVLQLLIVCLGLFGLRFKYYVKIRFKNAEFRHVLRQLPPRSIDQGIDSINSIVEANRADKVGRGYLTFYENAYTLHMAPILLVGTSISTAAFPRLTKRLSQGRPDLFRKEFLQILRVMIWIIVPIVVVSYFARGYLARIIFKSEAPEVALIFGFLCGAIFFRTIYAFISRYFYAHKDTKTPLFVSLFAIALNVYLAFTLSRPQPYGYGASGLAMAQSIVAAAEVFILMTIMVWRDQKLFDQEFWNGVLKIASVTGFTVLTAYIAVRLFPLSTYDKGFITLSTKLALVAAPVFIVHFVISVIFSLEETRPILDKLKKLVLKPVRIE